MTKEPQYLSEVRNMPELSNWPGKVDGEEWKSERSEVVWWMMRNGRVVSWVLSHFASKGVVAYDKDTGKWMGIRMPENVEVCDEETDEAVMGRPSVIAALMELRRDDLVENVCANCRGIKAASQVALQWAERSGVKISYSTARRFVKQMVQKGILQKTEAGFKHSDL